VDPHAVLGVAPDATDEELARAYRELAKRHHPDHAGDDGTARMRHLNEAYAAVRAARRRRGPAPARPDLRAPGWWLGDDVRAALGSELAGALDEGERVLAVAWAASGDSHEVRLAVTDKRLAWLRDDAITERVRWLRLSEVDEVEARLGRVRRQGELRVRARTRRRGLRFGEIAPDALRELAGALQERLPAGSVRMPAPRPA
jgi:curved DNA-binding protein CbpA